MWPICSRLRMTASLRLRGSFRLVTPTVGLIAWSLLPSQQFHISCHSIHRNGLARGRKSVTDILREDTRSDRAAFATLSALSFPGIPTWPKTLSTQRSWIYWQEWTVYNGYAVVDLRLFEREGVTLGTRWGLRVSGLKEEFYAKCELGCGHNYRCINCVKER